MAATQKERELTSALILFIQTLALYKSFTYLLAYLHIHCRLVSSKRTSVSDTGQLNQMSIKALCPVSIIPLPFFRCRFAVPVSHCRFRTPLPLPLPLRIFFAVYAVTERIFLLNFFTEQRNFTTAERRNGNRRPAVVNGGNRALHSNEP